MKNENPSGCRSHYATAAALLCAALRALAVAVPTRAFAADD